MMVHNRPAETDANRRHVAAIALMLSCLVCVGLAGCGDEAPVSGERTRSHAEDIGPHKVAWLEVASPISPAQWLVSRGEEKPRSESDPEVQHVAKLLATAHKRYRESERMIANRSVQVEAMLQQIGLAEGATTVLDGLTSIGGEVGQAEGYGAISQYYFNLRASHVSRADALATLKARYGSKS